jgi:hypothetical protein
VDGRIGADIDPFIGNGSNFLVEDGSGQAEGVDAHTEHTPGLMVGFEDRHGEPGLVQIMGCRQPRRAGADDGDLFRSL